MLLYTSSGDSMPGFDRVVFAPQAAEKLCSVGDLCDAGMVCVFTHDGLKTYKTADIKIEGKVFTYDERSLHRKVGEKDVSQQVSALLISLSQTLLFLLVQTQKRKTQIK